MVGGNSLSVVRIAAAIEAGFGGTVSVSDIFRRPTIIEQASWVSSRSAGRDETATERGIPPSNIVALQPHGDLPALYAVHGVRGEIANTYLAPLMGAQRPFMGIRASGVEHDAALPAPSIAALADRYADQIMARTPAGQPVHLMGFSGAGWYAHAVADALLRRGATIGLFAVLDSGGTVRIDRGIGLVTLPMRIVPRIRVHLRNLVALPEGQNRRDYLALPEGQNRLDYLRMLAGR